MQRIKHIYSELFYSDLDESGRSQELEKVSVFLSKNVDLKKLFLVKLNPKSKKILVNKYDGKIESLIDYVFIRTELAGVGNYNFIVESDSKNLLTEVEIIISEHTRKKLFSTKSFFDNKWAKELIIKGIVNSVLVNYCDGIWIELIKK